MPNRHTRNSLNYRRDLIALAIITRKHNLQSANNFDKMHKPWFVDFVQQCVFARDLVLTFVAVTPDAILQIVSHRVLMLELLTYFRWTSLHSLSFRCINESTKRTQVKYVNKGAVSYPAESFRSSTDDETSNCLHT